MRNDDNIDVSSPDEGLLKTISLLNKHGPKVAMCPRCPDAVLVSTLLFDHAEFYCLDCGAQVGWLSPRPEPLTDDLDARCEVALKEFYELVYFDDGQRRDDAKQRLAGRVSK